MEYKWNNKELERKFKLANLLRRKHFQNLYNELLNYQTMTFEDLYPKQSGKFNFSKLNYNELKNSFLVLVAFIEEDLYEISKSLYQTFNIPELLDNRIDYSKINLSNNDIIEIVREIVKTFNDKNLLNYYDYVIKNHYLYIKNNCEINESVCIKTSGITYYDAWFRKSYIILFRQKTIEDIETLFHEFFHAYFFKYINNNKKYIHRLNEIEGITATMYCHRYLEANGFKEIDKLKRETFATNIIESYKLLINELLIKYSYNLDKTNEELLKISQNTEPIKEEYLPGIIYIDGFRTSSDIISYLIAVDLINNISSPEELLDNLKYIKYNDTLEIKKNIKNIDAVTFYKDDLSNLKKERKLIRI